MQYAESYADCCNYAEERAAAREVAVAERVAEQLDSDAIAICDALDQDCFDNAELAEAICENDALRAMKYLRELVAERLTKRAEQDYDEQNRRR